MTLYIFIILHINLTPANQDILTLQLEMQKNSNNVLALNPDNLLIFVKV